MIDTYRNLYFILKKKEKLDINMDIFQRLNQHGKDLLFILSRIYFIEEGFLSITNVKNNHDGTYTVWLNCDIILLNILYHFALLHLNL
ncbi:hypothetical protein AGMMS49579_01430 [Spirochaetia bacterium]|nr:hypothetical protein AGMMS49579_01430 [Spirochaetia bacterium]